MNHPIKLTTFAIMFGVGTVLTGCGESQAQKQARERERQRIEAEQQAARDLQKSNEAVTAVGQKLVRKVEPLDVSTTQQKKADPPPAPPPKQ